MRHHFPEIDSTNLEARRMAEAGAAAFTIVTADRQTAGRGRAGRSWESETGNLSWSILLRPDDRWPPFVQLVFVAALAVADTLEDVGVAGDLISIKWPNDVLVDGKKLTGILVETSQVQNRTQPEWIIVGIGMNVIHYPAEQTRWPTTSLRKQGFENVTNAGVAEHLERRFVQRLNTWLDGGFDRLHAEIEGNLFRLGEYTQFSSGATGKEPISGKIIGIDATGRLMLADAQGSVTAHSAGEIVLAP